MNHEGVVALCLLVLLLPRCAQVQEAAHPDSSVRDYGAKGNGVTDDTAACQKATDTRAASGVGVVPVPVANHLIKTNLTTANSVTLQGEWQSSPTVDWYNDPKTSQAPPKLRGSVLLAVESTGREKGTPFIRVGFNSTLKGVTLLYSEQTKTYPSKSYSWTVQSTGADNSAVIDVLMVNPYQTIDFGTIVAGLHPIRNLYAQPL